MIRRNRSGSVRLALLLLVACKSMWAAPRGGQEKPAYSSDEYAAFQVADDEKNSQAKLKLLQEFSARYPDSTLMPVIYRDYYAVFLYTNDYRRAIEYADKFLA